MDPEFSRRLLLTMAIASSTSTALVFSSYQPLLAQVTPDNTLSTAVTSTDNLNFLIERGKQSGPNLFHSFASFSVPTNGSAMFNHETDIANIFSRVTGGSVSEIQGAISANGTANLFLINPAGIVFGENASLNVGGSFFATTAEDFLFGNGLEFSAVRPSSSVPLLTFNVSPGLQMGEQSGPVTINGPGHSMVGGGFFPFVDNGTEAGLQVDPGKTLGIIASDIRIIGGTIRVDGGDIQLNSVSLGVLTLQNDQGTWTSDNSAVEQFSNISLLEQALLESSGLLSGDIDLHGQNIQIKDGSLVTVQQTGPERGGDIRINAIESLRIFGASRLFPDQDTLFGTIPGVALSRVTNETLGSSSAGTIQVLSNRIHIEDGGSINNRSYGNGSSGRIDIDAAGLIEVGGTSTLDPDLVGGIASLTFGTADAGDVEINAQNLYLYEGATLGSATFAAGSAGDANIRVANELMIDGLDLAAATATNLSSTSIAGMGDSGDIVVDTARLSIINGAALSTGTAEDGNAGTLTVNASDSIYISGAVPELRVASVIGSDVILGDEAFRQRFGLADLPSGNSGNVQINTPRLIMTDGGAVSVRNPGLGDSGQLQINADEIILTQQGNITAFSASGQGGDIALNVNRFLLLNNGSSVTTEATGRRSNTANVDGGNLVISSPFILGFNNSDITANAFEGNGGNISISAQGLFGFEFRDRPTPASDITASSEFGLDGTVEISTPDIDPNSQVLELPDTFVDVKQLARSGCSLEQDQFVLAGRGGLPSNPIDLLDGDRTWIDIRDLSAFLNNETAPSGALPDAQPVTRTPLQEATGIAIASDGMPKLVASVANTVDTPPLNCS